MTLSQMKQILAEGGIQLTKSLGQNFLHDNNQLRRIVTLAELTPEDRVLEVGPGLGPLTELLLAQAGEVLGIEKDRRLVEVLKQRLGGSRNLSLVQDDALDYLRREKQDWSEWKLVSNLPYSVASPILVELAHRNQRPERMVATLQAEVVARLLAEVGGKDYGILTLLIQLHYQPGEWFKIPSSCFFPEPEVDSACIKLVRRTETLLMADEIPRFVRIVKLGFSQRRKMMLKLLKTQWPVNVLQNAFAQTGLSPQVRAEQVSLEQFVRLTRLMPENP